MVAGDDGQKAVKGEVQVGTFQELQKVLEDRDPPPVIKLTADIALPRGLVFRGPRDRQVLLQSADDKRRVTLSYAFVPPASPPERGKVWAGLMVEAGKLGLNNLRLEVAAEVTPNVPVAAVAVTDAGDARFVKCIFSQKTPLQPLLATPDLVPVASVLGWRSPKAGPSDAVPYLRFDECFFERGQAAVALNCRTAEDLSVISCAFGPHCTLFHLRGEDRSYKTQLYLKQVSAHLVYGPAFRLDGKATCKLTVMNSLFAAKRDSLQQGDGQDLICQTDESAPNFDYEGQRNGYYGLNAFLVRQPYKIVQPTNWAEFRAVIRKKGGRDEDSVLLQTSPWLDPGQVTKLLNPTADQQPRLAFRINPIMPELRTSPGKALGVDECVWGRTNDNLPVLTQKAPESPVYQLKKGEKLVDPQSDGGVPGVYRTFTGAVGEANPKDVIYIKEGKDNDGKVVPLPVVLTQFRGVTNLTFRPYPGCRPVLTLEPTRLYYQEHALFRLQHEKITFENLTFLLKPDAPFNALSVVAITGNGECIFDHCQVTLESSGDYSGVPLSVVALLPDSKAAMKTTTMMPLDRDRPVMNWKDCLVRGQGDLVCVKGSRPFRLAVKGSLLALTGTLLNVEAAAADVAENVPAATVKLDHVTALQHEHLFWLRAGKTGKGLVPTKVDADHNLFVSVDMRPLVRLEGADGDEQIRKLLVFKGDHNAYGGFDSLLETYPPNESIPMQCKLMDWRRLTEDNENTQRFGRVRFEGNTKLLNQDNGYLLKVEPNDFRIDRVETKLDLQGYGAPLEDWLRPSSPDMNMPNGEAHEEQEHSVSIYRKRIATSILNRCAGTAA